MTILSRKLQDLFNRQIGREIQSGIIYRQMASILQDMGYEGFQKWFLGHAEEEHQHSHKFSDFMEDHLCVVQYPAIEKPTLDGDKDKGITVQSIMAQAVKHEVFIKDSIHEMIKACREESEYGTELFLMEMAREQVEEINVFDTLRRRVMSCNDCPSALLIIDHDLKD